MFRKKAEKEKLFIRVLQWASDRGSAGFKLNELKKAIADDEEEWTWIQRMVLGEIHGNPILIAHLGSHHKKEGEYNYFITGAGASALVDYVALREARKSSHSATIWAAVSFGVAIVSLLIAAIVGGFQIRSTYLAQKTLEISANPVLNITHDPSEVPDGTDEVTIAAGLIPLKESKLNLLLINNSVSSIEQADMRMTLWQLYVNKENRHLTVCPLGYVDHHSNPHFTLTHLGTTNLFNNKFNLREGEAYPFDLDLVHLNEIQSTSDDAIILLKIDVNFVKSASQSNHSYVKLLVLNSFDGNALDPNIAPTLAMGLADRKEEVAWEGFKFPSLLHPFQEEEFLKYFEVPTPDLDLTPSGCREFRLSKELRTIYY
ncbi:hypothetical protein A3C20_00345 [Candidatus Kaiserbacteria bacterium RIFCSPHIGHO2_02_FULL_55_25]|uniref:Uncharacterized protein n=1 Tax=Candidatus Kaiserbacteria bacterium RIFCSPHIGHO2_02_FULL_55_25 TaxID=1798498 RepID=A0A1F6E583_9BACT|nr:MAG: hypothetical protein A2764_01740 [Candidatus Kaiserbacteria bacterium RIFCSPHIGHO2_01_FULL_55_79]OGG68806.1 MAG: hypothetical protein A3C20_00345 [Candidatus Kaiserbacteria bacterium RIFCSPHIGHO2_02_FULL_55_25]OGG77280.1 MAG: hypothetical protein A3F56_04435 [Candidatus Kaiserbacteria bacterium RIFCSPHIGHO2_12_FULL_55_13]OGG82976.1 MAG: hypothetical protein A3A42_03620 [Candidatus Kaiserbacteria bacterium RIFCSPLOWO2_01_FULL_55_25]